MYVPEIRGECSGLWLIYWVEGMSPVICWIPNTLGDLVRVSPVISWILNILDDFVRICLQRLCNNQDNNILDIGSDIVPIFGLFV